MLEGLETRTSEEHQTAALTEVREEYPKYFEAIESHPRSLVGKEVPKADGSGMETLRDSQDAREWQEQIKLQLAQEVKDRASRKVDEVRPMLETVHASVKLFQDNADLIPGTKQFDAELATKFVEFAKPYELRVEGKLTGYTIPVQPLVNQLRSQLVAARATAAVPAAPAAPSAAQQRAAEQARTASGQWTNPDAPQAGIPSRAGSSGGDAEDFSALFGTIGLPGFRI